MTNSHGGKRPGAGRKPSPPESLKIAYTARLQPSIVKYLRSQPDATATIEAALMRSKGYREWVSKEKGK